MLMKCMLIKDNYCIALRANYTTGENMQRAIWASFFHVAAAKKMTIILTVRLQPPPAGANFKETKLIKLIYKFIKLIKPIYLDLIKKSEVRKW